MKLSKLAFSLSLLICLAKIEFSNGARILAFLVTMSRSHLVVEEPVMRELARRGHEVIFFVLTKKHSRQH